MSSSASKEIHILIVEDNTIAAKVLVAIFTDLSCQIDVAKDGLSAVAQAKSKQYDLIVVDIGLPDKNGNEVAKEIRQWEQPSKHTPIIALTAHVDKERAAQYLQDGMDAVLSKPLSSEKAQAILKEFVF